MLLRLPQAWTVEPGDLMNSDSVKYENQEAFHRSAVKKGLVRVWSAQRWQKRSCVIKG